MKKLIVPVIFAALALCSCSSDKTPPELDVADRIYQGQNERFNIKKFCTAEDKDGSVTIKTKGTVDVSELGDYPITVIAEDEAGNKAEKEVTVTVRKSKKNLSNDTICKQVREFIFSFIAGGHSNIEFRGYSDDIGFFSKAYSKEPGFKTANGFEGTLSFEAVQYEDYKASVLNLIFSIDSDAMWYFPEKIELSGGGEKLEFPVSDTFQSGKHYGFAAAIGELSEKKNQLTPDYKLTESLKKMLSSGSVTMRAIGKKDSLEIKLTDKQITDFSDILVVYEELLTYY